jgi:starch synthase
MRIAYITPEAVPFSETGSIGDVAGHLPRYLSRRDLEVTVITPLYKEIDPGHHGLAHRLDKLEVDVGGQLETVAVLEGKMAGGQTNALFMDHPGTFHRDQYYGDFEDNHRRFYLFAAAALQLIEKYKLDPQVIHLNSWSSALFAPLLRQNADEKLAQTPLLFSLFSADREQKISQAQAGELNLDLSDLGDEPSYISLAAHHAQTVATLSPRYADKLKASAEFGDNVIGIVGGVNPETWNPATSRHLRQNYDTAAVVQRTQNKLALQESLGLPQTDTKPLVGMFGPFDATSGIDLLLDSADDWATDDLQFIFFGGRSGSNDRLDALVEKHPNILLRPKLTRAAMCRALAGLDAVVFPENNAPSSILQLRALRYGAIPLAHATDALADTLVDFDPISGSGTALLFADYNSESVVGAFERLRIHYPTRQRNQLIYNAMVQNYSWEEMALRYEALYRELDGAANADQAEDESDVKAEDDTADDA